MCLSQAKKNSVSYTRMYSVWRQAGLSEEQIGLAGCGRGQSIQCLGSDILSNEDAWVPQGGSRCFERKRRWRRITTTKLAAPSAIDNIQPVSDDLGIPPVREFLHLSWASWLLGAAFLFGVVASRIALLNRRTNVISVDCYRTGLVLLALPRTVASLIVLTLYFLGR